MADYTLQHTDGSVRSVVATLAVAEETLRSHGCLVQAEAVNAAMYRLRRFDAHGPITWQVSEARGGRQWQIVQYDEINGTALIAPAEAVRDDG